MPASPVFDADALRRTMLAFRDALGAHQDAINRLNVYPVPDGDTGTNMALTLASVADELRGAGPSMAEVCAAIAHGSLMGARGNSGVIVSQFLRGLTDGLDHRDAVDAVSLARSLVAAADAAYGAVLEPVEGTILTVARESAAAALDAARDAGSTVGVVEAATAAGHAALARTPELLPVLAAAGVVDAGGAGLLLLYDALLYSLDGRPLPPAPPSVPAPAPAAGVHAPAGTRYEVMFLLDVDDAAMAGFKTSWSGLGDSIVVVGGKGLWNCHIHTDDIGAAIEAALDAGGRPSRIRVTDLHDQVDELDWVREAGGVGLDPPVGEPVETGVVAVGAGDGVARIFASLGVQAVVVGGQSMNPSTAELLAAVDRVPAGAVIILPNNKNIIAVAEQVRGLTDKDVTVVPTRSVVEGLAALVAYDPEASLAHNTGAMATAAGHVVAGEVTRAVRDATTPAGAVHAGDFVGVARDGVVAVAGDAPGAASALLERLITDDHELVTVIAGADANPGDTELIEEWLSAHRPAVSVEVHHGGQPIYTYYFGVE